MDVQLQGQKPIEANLAKLPFDQLQLIQQQIGIELRDRELMTYNQNAELIQQNTKLTVAHQMKAIELRQYQERDQDLALVLQNIATELPQCNIQHELTVTQKIRKISDRAKALEEEKAKMEEEYKGKIAELEARQPGSPEESKEVRIQAFRIFATQMKCRVDEVQSLLANATNTWTELEELLEKKDVQKIIQGYEQAIARAEEEAKSLGVVQKMKKKAEIT